MKAIEKVVMFPHAGPRAYWRFCNPHQGALGMENLVKREPVQGRGETPTPVQSVHTCLWGAVTVGYLYSVMM